MRSSHQLTNKNGHRGKTLRSDPARKPVVNIITGKGDKLQDLQLQHHALVEAQAELEASRENYAELFDFAPVGYISHTSAGIIREINLTAAQLLGLDRPGGLGRPLLVFIAPEDRKKYYHHLTSCKQSADRRSVELALAKKNGPDIVYVEIVTVPATSNLGLYRSALIDITARKHAELELKKAHDELEQRVRERTTELTRLNEDLQEQIKERQKLETMVLNISERERQRIGQDLHDGLCQHLIGIRFKSRLLEEKLAKSGVREIKSVRAIEQLLDEAVEQARSQAHGLNPVSIGNDGLLSALRQLTAGVSRMFHVDCCYSAARDMQIDNQIVSIHLYRIAQEAITNAIKHGQAKKISVQLEERDGCIHLTVRDNGVGLSAAPAGHKPGMGMHIMKSRARTIGATLDVKSEEKNGTVVTCLLPWFQLSE